MLCYSSNLHDISELLNRQDFQRPWCPQTLKIINRMVKNISNDISDAAFSDAEDHSLKRYLNIHLKEIIKLLDFLDSNAPGVNNSGNPIYTCVVMELLALIDFLAQFFWGFLDQELAAPLIYAKREVASINVDICLLKSKIVHLCIDDELQNCLISYLNVCCDAKSKLSFRSLSYLKIFVRELLYAEFTTKSSDVINQKLAQLNFNHLAYFVYRQKMVRMHLCANFNDRQKDLESLKEEKAIVMSLPVRLDIVYLPEWPSLKTMLSEWLDEEINLKQQLTPAENLSKNSVSNKLPLNLSVAQLSCFTKLFFEENLINNKNLKHIFQFVSCNYSTKRQPAISPGSLSKEFYSISQVTAARVRAILQKMITRINHQFFPVLAAISAAACVYSGVR